MANRVRQPDGRYDHLAGTLNERILKQCHELYTDVDQGLIKIAKRMNLTLIAPRKKITVLLIGNHSAGKSSYINWYIEEHIQKTGVAIETQGLTFVTSGKKREMFTGNATLHLYSHFEPLRKIDGVVDYLTTELSTSKQKKFNLVTFIDSPGLVDGDMKYPFDVNSTILWLGDLADLIFIFFEPMGQALCKRTLDIVEQLSIKNGDRMKFYLSKADEAGNESDRQRVLMQIVQELCKKPCLNKTGFDMPTIYIPNPSGKPSRCINQIEETCKEIEKTINQTVQNTLNCLEKDCEKIASLIDDKLREDKENEKHNFKVRTRSVIISIIGLMVPILLLTCFLSSALVAGHLNPLLNANVTHSLLPYADPFSALWLVMSLSSTSCIIITSICVIFIFLAKLSCKSKPTLTKNYRVGLVENKDFVKGYVKGKKEILYKEYLNECVADHDLQ